MLISCIGKCTINHMASTICMEANPYGEGKTFAPHARPTSRYSQTLKIPQPIVVFSSVVTFSETKTLIVSFRPCTPHLAACSGYFNDSEGRKIFLVYCNSCSRCLVIWDFGQSILVSLVLSTVAPHQDGTCEHLVCLLNAGRTIK